MPECSRVQEPGWGAESLSSQGQHGGNSSSRESKLPRVQPRARSGAQDLGQGPRMEGSPGRPPRAMAAPGTSGSAAPVATPRLQLSRRVAGEGRGGGEGNGEGKGGARLLVPCACVERRRAAPRALLSAGSAPAGRLLRCWPPPRLAAGAKAHPRRAGLSGVPLARPLTSGRLPAATSGAPRARTRRAPNVPRLGTPALHARAAPPQPAQRPAAVGRVSSPRIAPAARTPLALEPPPPLKSAINFPSLPPPRAAPATQTPPPDALSLTSRLAQPLPPGRAWLPTPLHDGPPGSLRPPPRPRSDPRERWEPGQALRA